MAEWGYLNFLLHKSNKSTDKYCQNQLFQIWKLAKSLQQYRENLFKGKKKKKTGFQWEQWTLWYFNFPHSSMVAFKSKQPTFIMKSSSHAATRGGQIGWIYSKVPFTETSRYLTCLVVSWKIPLVRLSLLYLTWSSSSVNHLFHNQIIIGNCWILSLKCS